MKKKFISLLCILASFLFIMKVDASSLNVNITGDTNFTKEISLNVQVNNLVDFTSSCKGLCGFVGNLEYDKNKIELVSISALNGFDLVQGNKIVLYKATGVSSGSSIMTMKFRNKSLTNNESTKISFTNINVSDGDKDIVASNASKTIKYIEEPKKEDNTNNNNETNNDNNNKPSSGNNNSTTKPSNENTSNNIINKKSSNNYIETITLSNGKIEFSKDILTYDIIVENEIEEIIINAKAEDDKSVIEGVGSHKLNVGNNIIKLNVKAEDGSERTYTINFSREKENIKVNDNETPNEEINSSSKEEPKNNNFIFIIIGSISLLILIILIIVITKKRDNKIK